MLPPARPLDSFAVACPSGRRDTPGKRVGGQLPRGFESLGHRGVMSRDTVPTCVGTSFHLSGSTMRLVVAGWVQSELSDQLAIFGQHPQVQIINEH
jgi:hypothetical protein